MWRTDVPPGQLTLLPRAQQSCGVTPTHAHLPTLSVYVPWDQGRTGKQLLLCRCPGEVARDAELWPLENARISLWCCNKSPHPVALNTSSQEPGGRGQTQT